MSIYLDTSVLVPTLVQEPVTDAVRAYLAISPDRIVSDLAAAEVASALARLIRTGLLTEPEAAARLDDFDAWRVGTSIPAELHAADARLACAYVRRFDLALRAPDALHLAMCRRLDLTLVTLDGRLARAADQLGIKVAVPGADNAPDPR
jgi:uncharacterized protein